MNEKCSIVFSIACVAMLVGCSATNDPLQGKWQGTIEVSGKLSLNELTALPGEMSDETPTPPRTDVAVLTLDFLRGNQLRLKTEPMPSKSPFGPKEVTASYKIVEALPGQYRLQLDIEKQSRTLQLRFTDSENMIVTEESGAPQVLPIAMTRMDAA